MDLKLYTITVLLLNVCTDIIAGVTIDLEANDDCTVAFRACIDTVQKAVGGDATVTKYNMASLVGTSADYYGYLRVMKTDFSALLGRRKRQAFGDVDPTEIALADMATLWITGAIQQTDTCGLVSEMDIAGFYEGNKCVRDVSDRCPNSFGYMNNNFKIIPANELYYRLRDDMCTESCSNYAKKSLSMITCEFVSTQGQSLIPYLLTLQQEVMNVADSTATCTAIKSQLTCMTTVIGCCPLLGSQMTMLMANTIKEPYKLRCGLSYTDCVTPAPTTESPEEVTTSGNFTISNFTTPDFSNSNNGNSTEQSGTDSIQRLNILLLTAVIPIVLLLKELP